MVMERTGDAIFCVSTGGRHWDETMVFAILYRREAKVETQNLASHKEETAMGGWGLSMRGRGVERTGDAKFCVSTRRTPLGWKDGIWGMTNKQRDTQTCMSRDAAWRTKISDVPCQA